MTADELRTHLRDLAKPSVTVWAVKNGLTPALVYDVLAGRREPTPGLVEVIGFQRVMSYEPVPTRKRAKPSP